MALRTNVVRNHNIWKDGGGLHHDHATHEIKDYSWASNCFFNFINNHCFSISCAQWHLWFMQKQWFPLINFCTVCDPSYMPLFVFAWHRVFFIVVMILWYSCKKWILVEEDFSNLHFEFHFDEKKWTLVARFTYKVVGTNFWAHFRPSNRLVVVDTLPHFKLQPQVTRE